MLRVFFHLFVSNALDLGGFAVLKGIGQITHLSGTPFDYFLCAATHYILAGILQQNAYRPAILANQVATLRALLYPVNPHHRVDYITILKIGAKLRPTGSTLVSVLSVGQGADGVTLPYHRLILLRRARPAQAVCK